MEIKKLIPLGIDDFKDVKENCYYVDKTPLIRDIVSQPPSSAILFTRPRRFGKSLTLSMLRYFFEISEEDRTALFSDTAIYRDAEVFSSYFGRFPVISLNLKNALGEEKGFLLSKTYECIRSEYRRFGFLLDSDRIDSGDKEYIKGILSPGGDAADFSSALANLTRYLHSHYGERVIVLIDEYDTPLRYAYENGFYKEVISFFKSLFGEALKSNQHLYYALMTGILQVSKESIFSGLNNLSVNTVLDDSMDEGFGFTEKEVDELLSHYCLSEKKGEFRQWYDGYLFGSAKIYNPLSVLSAIKNGGRMAPYWSNTSEKNALFNLVSKSSFDMAALSSILLNKSLESEIDLAISYLDLDSSPSFLLSYLLATGYLTVEGRLSYDVYSLKLPNKEIEAVFEKEIVNRYVPREKSTLPDEMRAAFLNGDAARIKTLFEKHVLSGLSYYELGQEKPYQVIVISVLSLVLKDYRVRSEVNAGFGRGDVIATPNNPNFPAFVIESKALKGRVSSKRINESANGALRQIEEMRYIDEFANSKVKKVFLYGLCFASKTVGVAFKEIALP